MSDFLVSPSETTSWRLEPEEFERRLRERFPQAEIVVLKDPASEAALRFELAGDLDGRFWRDGQVLALDGPLEPAAEVAAWFRELVPPAQELVFWDEGYSFSVALTDGISAQQVVARAEVEA